MKNLNSVSNAHDRMNQHESKPEAGTSPRKMPAHPKDGADHASQAGSMPMHGTSVMKKSKPKDGADHSGHVSSMPCAGTSDCM